MFTVELLPDEGLDHGVREMWKRLRDAGFPSLATHPHPTNRPHLTLLTAATRDGLAPLTLPVDAELGRARMLGRALVLEVTASAELRALQERAWSSLESAEPWPPPAEWVPHVSLALRVPEESREAALRLLADEPPARGRFVAARSYDTATRTVVEIR